MRKITCLVIISLFCLTSLLPAVNSFYFENKINVLENSLDIDLQSSTYDRWMKTFGGVQWDYGWSVQQTADYGYIIAGGTNSFGAGEDDIWLIKTDSNGNMVWDRTFGGKDMENCGSVQQTTDEGYILIGGTESFGAGNWDVWLIKTDTNGYETWNRTFGGKYEDFGCSVQQTTDGGYIITGMLNQYSDTDSVVWLIKTTSYGNKVWDKIYTKNFDGAWSVQQTSDGGYIISGFSVKDQIGTADYDIWLIKTDNNGNEIWNRTFGGTKEDWGYCVKQTFDGGFIITGETQSFGAGNWDVWLIKTDNNGNEIWNRTFGGKKEDRGSFVKQTFDGGFIITGRTSSIGAGKTDVWLIKTDSNGYETWNRTFGGTSSDFSASVQQTADYGYIIAGYTYSFGAGDSDVWLIKTDSQGLVSEPPEKPTITGESSGKPGTEYNYSFVSTDPEDDEISYFIDWGDNTSTDWSTPLSSGEFYTSSHTWSEQGNYSIKAKARDVYGVESDCSTFEMNIISEPPEKPTITGHTNGKPGTEYEYKFMSIDPDGDDIEYCIDWGDNTSEVWIGPYPSGAEATAKHTWSEKGSYIIKAKARNVYGAESDWAILEVSMPKNKAININLFLQRFFQRFPFLVKILNQILL